MFINEIMIFQVKYCGFGVLFRDGQANWIATSDFRAPDRWTGEGGEMPR
jgi:hypothetical protein